MSKKNFTFGLRVAATADVMSLVDFDEANDATDSKWGKYGAGMVFSGKELNDFFDINKGNRARSKMYWRRLDGSIVEIASNWKGFKKLTRLELEGRDLINAVRERRIARRIVVLRVVAVVGAIAYGAATQDIKGAMGIMNIGNKLADALADGNLSVQDIAGLVQLTGEQLGVDIEGEIRAQLSAAGVSQEDQDELIGPLLDDLDEYEETSGSSNGRDLLVNSGMFANDAEVVRFGGGIRAITLGGGGQSSGNDQSDADRDADDEGSADDEDSGPIGVVAGVLGVGIPLGFAILTSLIF